MKFQSAKVNPINGRNFIHEEFGYNTSRSHNEFKAFFASCDPAVETPPRSTHPNWKVQPMFKHAIFVSKAAVCMGVSISCDEQTIGCQGRHPDVRRIKFKRSGDGFMCDSVCSDGYTYSFFFRNQPSPKVFTNMGLSPLHARTMSLLEQLPGKYYKCSVYNLYTSAKVCR